MTKDNKANTNNTAVTVIGVDTADADSADVNANSSNVSTTHGKASFTFDSDDSDFPFHNVSAGGGILVAIIAIIAVFGFPVFILFVIFFFRYKNPMQELLEHPKQAWTKEYAAANRPVSREGWTWTD